MIIVRHVCGAPPAVTAWLVMRLRVGVSAVTSCGCSQLRNRHSAAPLPPSPLNPAVHKTASRLSLA